MTQETEIIQIETAQLPKDENDRQNILKDEQKNLQKEAISNELKLYAHLKTYPIANSWIRIAHWISMPRVIRPYLYQLAFSDPVKGYTIMMDDFVDERLLGTLDSVVPQVKTLRMRDIRDFLTGPFSRVYESTRGTLGNSHSTADKLALERARLRFYQTSINMRNQLSSISSRTRFAILSRVNPLVKPLNTDLIKYINQMDPKHPIQSEKLEDQDNQFLNTLKLMDEGLVRTRSIAATHLEQLRVVPANASKRVSEVYHESQEKRGDNNNSRVIMLIASLDTIRALANDGYKFLRPNNTQTTNSANMIEDNNVPPEL